MHPKHPDLGGLTLTHMMPGKAGKALCARLNAELRHAEQAEGRPLEWTSRELLVIEAAMQAADRAAELRQLWRAEMAREEPRPSTLTKLAAEARLSERAVVDLCYRVNPGLGQAKSERHVRAGRARWAARDQAWAAAREAAGS